MTSKIALILTLFLSISCAINTIPAVNNATKIAAEKDMKVKIHHTKNFDIFTLEKISADKKDLKKPIRIYIEGDGNAFINRYRASPDPTPTSDFVLSLIKQDSSPNLVYIARPCQYINSDNCEEKYWTYDRFSPEVISSLQEVVDSFPHSQELELVGYSGGAQIILHLTNKNIRNIRTIAGNLDLKAFSEFHKIPQLQSPKLDYHRISKIRQTHFVGTEDSIIPINVFKRYKLRMKKKNCINLRLIPDANHKNNWITQWDQLLERRPLCR
jgi:hypothetical protein